MPEAWYDKDAAAEFVNLRWWDESKEDVARALFALVDHLRQHQGHHHRRNLHHARLYGNLDLLGLDYYNYARARDYEDRVTYNVVESAIDTVHSDIVANKSKPMFLTDKGKWKQKRQAQGLNRFIVGQFHHTRVYPDTTPAVARDALVFGTGVAKVYRRDNTPWCERVLCDDILVDDLEARDGRPRQYFQIDAVDRQTLLAMPQVKKSRKLTEAVRLTKRVEGEDHAGSIADLVQVYEAWRLPSSEGADDGRHVLAVRGGAIEDGPWERCRPPLVFLPYKRRTLGMWGKGVAEILDGSQVAINELLWKVHMALKLAGPKVFVEPGSGVNMAHLDNEIWGIIECISKPHYAVFESVSPDLFRQLSWEIEQAYGLVGVNVLSARSEIPAGMAGASGKALRLYTDTKSKRFLDFHGNYDQFHLDLAEQYIELNRQIVKDNETYEVKGDDEEKRPGLGVLAPGTNKNSEWEWISWKDVDLARDRYVMQAWPTNLLSMTPSARLEDLKQLLEMFPDMQPYALDLLDFPDVRAIASLQTSSVRILQQVIERILYCGEMQAPEPMMDLQQCLKMSQNYYLQGRLEGVPEENLSKLRSFMAQIKAMLEPPPPPPTAMPPEVPPGAGGEAPGAPVSPPGGPPMPPPAGGFMPPEGLPAPELLPPEGGAQ